MKNLYRIILALILLGLMAFGVLALYDAYLVDQCTDKGGTYNNKTSECEFKKE